MKQFCLTTYWANRKRKYADYVFVLENNINIGFLSKTGKIVKRVQDLNSKRNAIRIIKQNFKVKKLKRLYEWEIKSFEEIL